VVGCRDQSRVDKSDRQSERGRRRMTVRTHYFSLVSLTSTLYAQQNFYVQKCTKLHKKRDI
jgi:hypothetical protein